MTDWWLGARLAQIRHRRGVPQDELAYKVGLSQNYISKFERGDRLGMAVVTFCDLVDALGMQIKIVDRAGAGKAEDDVREQDNKLLLPLRRLLLPVAYVGTSLDEAELTLAKLRRRVADSAADFNKGRYAKLATDLPPLIISIEAATGLHEGETNDNLHRLLARAYTLAAETIILLRDESLACEAIRRAMDAAEKAGDAVLRALAGKNYGWTFTRQGMFAEAEAVALRVADEVGEPSMRTATPGHIAIWGELHRLASRAAAYDNRPDTARDLMAVAHSAAVRIDGGTADYGKYWAVFNPAMISITRVEQALITGDAELALRIGEGVQRADNLLLNWWTTHLRRRADAQTTTRDYAGAIETMKMVRRLAPEWIKNDREAGVGLSESGSHAVVLRLLDAVDVRRSRSSGLAELAGFMGVEP